MWAGVSGTRTPRPCPQAAKEPGVLSLPGSSVSRREGAVAIDVRPAIQVPYSRANAPAGSSHPPRR
jgi:hypothetical protein